MSTMPGIQGVATMQATHIGRTRVQVLAFVLLTAYSAVSLAQQWSIPASDTLGADDLAENPTFIGGIANSGSTAHGIW